MWRFLCVAVRFTALTDEKDETSECQKTGKMGTREMKVVAEQDPCAMRTESLG